MLRNYLKIAVRKLLRNWGYTTINLVGLAVGLAACLLIGLYVRHELSYDDFHEKGDRIYRVDEITERSPDGSPSVEIETGPTLIDAIPSVEKVVRINEGPGRMRQGNDVKEGLSGFYAGEDFFEIFSFDLVNGSDSTVLQRPSTVVLTESTASRLFGRKDPIGKTVTIEEKKPRGDLSSITVEVTGVVENVPSNSHFTFDYLLSLHTLRNANGKDFRAQEPWTYALLEKGTKPARIDNSLQKVAENYAYGGGPYRLDLRPLNSLYFEHWTPQSGDKRYLYILSVIALVILLIGCANYMNLATARATHRIREVGIRKALGADRRRLAGRFLGESALLSLAALPIALLLVWNIIPVFNRLADSGIQFRFAESPRLLLGAVGASLATGLVAGSYPALYLSRFQPVEILRERFSQGWGGARLRKGLVVVQFALSAALIFCTGIILQQLNYVQHKKLGFDRERVITVPLKRPAPHAQARVFRQEVVQHPEIQQASVAGGAPAVGPFGRSSHTFSWKESELRMRRGSIDAHFLETMDLQLLAGRNFTEQEVEARTGNPRASGSKSPGVLLNETAVEALGWSSPQEAVGQRIEPLRDKTVVGVVEDFHFRSLHHQIRPLALEPGYQSMLIARIAPEQVSAALDVLRETWAQFDPAAPVEYHFLDDQIDQLYQEEQRMATVIGIFSGIAVLLACLGLLGLAAYAAERRRKEIGIRKVLGATTSNILTLLSKEFLLLVGIACAMAVPVAYLGMTRWLQDFAYRVEISPWLFVGAGLLALVIALVTISVQALRAARTDPAQTLRDE